MTSPASNTTPVAQRTSAKLLSVCIPTYNRAKYLPETLESLLPQLAGDVELLVYDTGSTDGTPELMRGYQDRFPNLRLFLLDERRGFDEALLLLLAEARGDYVWYFGSDDVLDPGAVDEIRRAILRCRERPSFIFLNHSVVDHGGRLLIPSNAGRVGNQEFRTGRECVARLGLHLGYISACIFRREYAQPLTATDRFLGSLWMGLHLNLLALAKPGPALYLGRAMVRARRNPGNIYDYGEIFCRRASEVFWHARGRGIGWSSVYRAMNLTVRLFHFRYAVSRRCEDPAELDRALPAMLRACWAYPWFWILIVPVRLIPSRLARAARDSLQQRRAQQNARAGLRGRAPVAREQG